MKWLSDQLVFKSNNNFPVNPYVDYPETKNEKPIEKQNKNNNTEKEQQKENETEKNNENNNITGSNVELNNNDSTAVKNVDDQTKNENNEK